MSVRDYTCDFVFLILKLIWVKKKRKEKTKKVETMESLEQIDFNKLCFIHHLKNLYYYIREYKVIWKCKIKDKENLPKVWI